MQWKSEFGVYGACFRVSSEKAGVRGGLAEVRRGFAGSGSAEYTDPAIVDFVGPSLEGQGGSAGPSSTPTPGFGSRLRDVSIDGDSLAFTG